MSLIWTLHRKLKQRIPHNWIRSIRSFVESHFDFPWRHEFYSQFGEDAVLQSRIATRAWLKSGGIDSGREGLSKGFYVDVGAYAPKEHSNTYWFYRQGWRGINIDAAPGSMKIFDRVRSRDINIEAAISDQEREMTFYTWGTPSVCNTLSAEHAERFTKIMGKEPSRTTIRTTTLASILDRHLPVGQTIDFFTIDAEEHTLEVLQSNNWEKYSPMIVVVELDVDTVDQVVDSTIVEFMTRRGYTLRAWVGASVLFELAEDRESPRQA